MRNQLKAMIPTRLVVAATVWCTLIASMPAGGSRNAQTEGARWLSWSAEAKGSYVAGYLRGFQQGKHVACSFYEQNIGQGGSSLPPEELPHHVCMKSLPQLTALYYQAYVDKITEYYTKYPNDREAGLSQLMTNLAMPPALTVDQIHAKLSENSKRQ